MKNRKYLLVFLLLPSLAAWAQAPAVAEPANPDKLYNILTNVFYLGFALVFLLTMFYVVRVNQFLYKQILKQQAAASGTPLTDWLPKEAVAQESYWEQWKKKYWEDAAPLDKEGEILLDHSYDGIHELDNHLPPFWLNMFYGTIIFSVIYMYYYHWGGNGPSLKEEYEIEVAEGKRQRAIALASMADQINESNVTALSDAGDLGAGKAIYTANCVACHGAGGEGGVGPNLTDDHWIHGGGIKNVFRVVTHGVPEKGMIAWSAQLRPSDIQKVSSYILSMQGTNPPNAKAPQGEIWKEEKKAE